VRLLEISCAAPLTGCIFKELKAIKKFNSPSGLFLILKVNENEKL
jgi:hypothetical protein